MRLAAGFGVSPKLASFRDGKHHESLRSQDACATRKESANYWKLGICLTRQTGILPVILDRLKAYRTRASGPDGHSRSQASMMKIVPASCRNQQAGSLRSPIQRQNEKCRMSICGVVIRHLVASNQTKTELCATVVLFEPHLLSFVRASRHV
jgi:hypothetical protein